jgi:hypothetical protein
MRRVAACDMFPHRIRNQTDLQCARVAGELHGIASSSLTVSQLQLLISIITGSAPKLHLPKPVFILHEVVLKPLILELSLYSFFCCLETFAIHFFVSKFIVLTSLTVGTGGQKAAVVC